VCSSDLTGIKVFKIIVILIGAPKMEGTDTEVIFSYYGCTSCLNAYRVVIGKPEGMKPLARLGHTCEKNAKLDVGCCGVDWIRLSQDREQWRALMK
jgi:hypothetical protein